MPLPLSSCNKYCDPRELRLLDEVEYCLVRKNGRLSADEIRRLEKGNIPAEVLSVCPSIAARDLVLVSSSSSSSSSSSPLGDPANYSQGSSCSSDEEF